MSLLHIYLLFVKYGFLAFGGGYVLVQMFIHDLVEKYALITQAEFGNLLAISQMTPGPIGINAATYIGYVTNGVCGGVIATLGLLTPAILLVLAAAYSFKKWEKSVFVQGLLYGVRPATLGLIIAAILVFANLAIFTAPLPIDKLRHLLNLTANNPSWEGFGIRIVPLLIAIGSAVALGKFKVSIVYIIFASAIIGAVLA